MAMGAHIVIVSLLLVHYAKSLPWDKYILAPFSRTIVPLIYLNQQGNNSANPVVFPILLDATNSSILFDFEREVGGEISFVTGECTSTVLQLAFSESILYVNTGDNSNGGSGSDGLLTLPVTANTNISAPARFLRGGFRYIKMILTSGGMCQITQFNLFFTATPLMADLRNYSNHFWCSDDLINRIWYSGAYTAQLSIINPNQGRVWPAPSTGWNNSATVGTGIVPAVISFNFVRICACCRIIHIRS